MPNSSSKHQSRGVLARALRCGTTASVDEIVMRCLTAFFARTGSRALVVNLGCLQKIAQAWRRGCSSLTMNLLYAIVHGRWHKTFASPYAKNGTHICIRLLDPVTFPKTGEGFRIMMGVIKSTFDDAGYTVYALRVSGCGDVSYTDTTVESVTIDGDEMPLSLAIESLKVNGVKMAKAIGLDVDTNPSHN